MKRSLVESLKQVWNDLTKEYEDYDEEIKMLWHENDLRLHLGHRLIVKLRKIGEYEIHANVKIDPEYFKGTLKQAIERALLVIKESKKGANYVDLVVNWRQDITNPFLICAEVKYYYYSQPPYRILEQLKNDLKRLSIIKREGVAEAIACLMLNAQYEPKSKLMQELEGKLDYYEREFGMMKLVAHLI